MSATVQVPVVEVPVVEIEDVKVMRGDCVVLSVDQLSIGPGVTAVVGPNGSGKSTLLHLIAGLLEPISGKVTVLGEPVAPGNRRVAYVLQSQAPTDHLPVTAREVVALGRTPYRGPWRRYNSADHTAIDDALERMDVTDLANRHLADMSGGQRQRVLIAQGLAQQADVLLFDEPTAGLDIASIQTIRREIEAERQAGRAVFVATHDLAEAAAADTAVLMAGHVVASGDPAEVLAPHNLRTAYAGRLVDLDGHAVVVDDGAHHHTPDDGAPEHHHFHEHEHGEGHSHAHTHDPSSD